MNKKTLLVLFVVLALVLSSCSPLGISISEVTPAETTQTAQATYTPLPTYTPYPTQEAPTQYPTEQPMLSPTSTTEPIAVAVSQNNNYWQIQEIDPKDDPINAAWLSTVQTPSPELWPTFPNVANPKVSDFQVANGAEYGMDDSPFCEQDQRCDWVIPAWHYRLISGDYKFTSPEFSYSCQNVEGQPRKGCLIVLFNVMNESYIWRDQSVDNGFTVMGRYWNGDELQWAIWGLTSHATANMLNYPTIRNSATGDVLNAGNAINAGANCGVQPNACKTVDVMVIIHAGDRIIATMHTTVSK